MGKVLRTENEIRAAGRTAVAGWKLTEHQVDLIVALIWPVRHLVWRRLDVNREAVDPE